MGNLLHNSLECTPCAVDHSVLAHVGMTTMSLEVVVKFCAEVLLRSDQQERTVHLTMAVTIQWTGLLDWTTGLYVSFSLHDCHG